MKKFDKQSFVALRQDIAVALEGVARKHGLKTLSIGNITFNDYEFSSKLTGTLEIDQDDPKILEENERNSSYLGYDQNIVGKEYFSRGKKYRVVSLEMNRPTWPIIAEEIGSATGKPERVKCKPGIKIDGVNFDNEKNIYRFK